MRMLILVITIMCVIGFIFGPIIFTYIMPDYSEIVANFLCGVAGFMAPPFIQVTMIHVAIFALLGSLIFFLLLFPALKNPIVKGVFFVVMFLVFFIMCFLFVKDKPIPWFSGDDIGFAAGITGFLTVFAIAPFVKNRTTLLGIIIMMFFIFWGVYKFGGIYVAREAEKRGAEKCLEEFPIELPVVTPEGIEKKKFPYDILNPVFLVGGAISLMGFAITVIAIMKIKGRKGK